MNGVGWIEFHHTPFHFIFAKPKNEILSFPLFIQKKHNTIDSSKTAWFFECDLIDMYSFAMSLKYHVNVIHQMKCVALWSWADICNNKWQLYWTICMSRWQLYSSLISIITSVPISLLFLPSIHVSILNVAYISHIKQAVAVEV